MCLAIPARIIEIVDASYHVARVEIGGVRRKINFALIADETPQIGDYVLVHVGFAMRKIDEQEAAETLRLLEQLGDYEQAMAEINHRDTEGEL